MKLIEIRDLDGPNIFLLEPAIKIEIAVESPDAQHVRILRDRLDIEHPLNTAASLTLQIGQAIEQAIVRFYELSGSNPPRTMIKQLETPGHIAVAYSWDHRRFALSIAATIQAAISGQTIDLQAESFKLVGIHAEWSEDDRPLLIRDVDRTVPAIAVTGTNGKTTTTRLIAHILRGAGMRVGWCSSSGVYIDGAQVIDGDYSGPSGARRVLTEPGLDAGVLETARGGILLRGTAYESNDVSVFTNISADHLDLQGIRTVEGLAETKSVVSRVTKADGVAVLNADDPLVMAATQEIRASKWLISQKPDNPVLRTHIEQGGTALLRSDNQITVWQNRVERPLVDLNLVPIAYGGTAHHMIENALCAAAATLAFGLSDDEVRQGLETFENSPEHNQGRLNVLDVNGVTVIVDYAHNESGLKHLIDFARLQVKPDRRLMTIIGTAGDRTDRSLRDIGRVAAEGSDLVIVKGTERYLRGRPIDELIALYEDGVKLGGKSVFATTADELSAVDRALQEAKAGDTIAIMAQEQIAEILDRLQGQRD